MKNFVFYFLYIVPFVILYLYRENHSPKIFHVSVANILMFFYLVFNHIGLAIIYSMDTVDRIGGSQTNQNVLILLALYTNIVMIAYLLTGRLMGSRTSCVSTVQINAIKDEKVRWLAIMVLLIVTSCFAYIKFSSGSPLQILLSGDAHAAMLARLNAFSEFENRIMGIKHSYVNIFFVILNYVSILLFVKFIVSKKMRFLGMYFLCFMIGGLFAFSNVAKGFIVVPLYQILFVFAVVYYRGVFISRFIVIMLLVSATMVSVFSFYVMGNESINFFYTFERMVLGYLYVQYLIVDYFSFDNLLYGASLPSWYSLGLHDHIDLQIFAWKAINPLADDFYTAPFSFVGEAHANFHIFGVILISFLLFSAMRLVDYMIAKIRSPHIHVSMLVFLSIYFSRFSSTSAMQAVVDYTLLSVLIFAFWAYRVTIPSTKTLRPDAYQKE